MEERFVEEIVLKLKDLKVGIGVLKRFKNCTEGVLTTYRLTFKQSDEVKTVFISTITSVKISNKLVEQYVLIQCGPLRYYITCSETERLYLELLKVVKLNETSRIFNKVEGIGGINRVLESRRDEIKESEKIKELTKDFNVLKGKTQKVKEILVKISKYDREGFNRGIDQVFKRLGVDDIFAIKEESFPENTMDQLKEIMKLLFEKNEMIVLHEFYCAANRLMMTNLLSPSELIQYVKKIEHEGECQLHKIGKVYLLTKTKCRNLEDEFFKDMAKLIKKGPIDRVKLAREGKMSEELAKIKLKIGEKMGLVSKDESLERTTYYPNEFAKYQCV